MNFIVGKGRSWKSTSPTFCSMMRKSGPVEVTWGVWIRSEIQTQVAHCLSVFHGPQWAKGSAQEKGHQKYLPNQTGWGLAARQALDRGATVFGPPSSLWFSTLASIPVLCQEHPPFTSPCPYDRLFDVLQVFASMSPSHWERPWPFLNCSPSASSCFSITSFTFLCSILLALFVNCLPLSFTGKLQEDRDTCLFCLLPQLQCLEQCLHWLNNICWVDE